MKEAQDRDQQGQGKSWRGEWLLPGKISGKSSVGVQVAVSLRWKDLVGLENTTGIWKPWGRPQVPDSRGEPEVSPRSGLVDVFPSLLTSKQDLKELRHTSVLI